MNLKKAWLAIPVGAALALSACSGGTNANAVVMNGSEPQNPLLPGMTSENGGGKILSAMFSQLVRYDVDGTPVLDVAESIEPNEDASEWTIKLHNDRKFSDGTPVTAADFVASYERATSEKSIYRQFFTFVDSVEAKDDKTITITLKHPFTNLKERFVNVRVVPASMGEDALKAKPCRYRSLQV